MMARQLCEDKSKDMASSTGLFYPDVSSNSPTLQPHLMNHIQGFVTDPEMFNLTTGMEMIGFSKNLHPHSESNGVMWKSFFGKPSQHAGPSSSKTMNESSCNFYNQHEYSNKQDFTSGISETSSENLIVGGAHDSAPWQENRLMLDDSSLRCVFPCEGNERPSQGLSLSLSSTNPSSIGLQSFELRQTNHHQHLSDFVSRDGYFGKSVNAQQQQQVLQDGYMSPNKAANIYQGHFLIKNSKFLVPAQLLLNEFCSLGTKENDVQKQKQSLKNKPWEEGNNGGGSSKNHSLGSLEFVELQKRKTRLLSMLEEVDRRYKHYCNQMKAVVSSFEAVAGNGAATVYSALALRAMSRHFRCLKDGIMEQIQTTRKAMGEKDPVAPGTTRGETPRLKIIDQSLRQQRAFQQISMMETHPWRPQRGLPERSVSVLRAWLFEHFLHPYPSDVDKHILARQTGLSRSQVSNWFINARVRLWKPMVEEMYLEEEKEQQNDVASSEGGGTNPEGDQNAAREDQKPTQARLLRIDSEMSSMVSNTEQKNDSKSGKSVQNDEQMNESNHPAEAFGAVELDFSSYAQQSSGVVGYDGDSGNERFRGGGGGVSLTLGLQQQGESGVSLAFPPATQSSMFYPRDHIEECQTVEYSLLDGEGQNMPYRNLMGTQLLHDLV